MATSGTSIIQLSRDDLINAALRKLLVIGEGQTANASQLVTATSALNNLVAEFRTLGMSIWARKEYIIPLVEDQSVYTLGIGQEFNTAYPQKVYKIEMEQGPDWESRIDMNMLSFMDFGMLPITSTGTPVNAMYQPQINKGVLTVWPTPDATMYDDSRLRLTYQAPFEYFIAGVDTPDFPEEWNNALIYALASTLGDEMGKPMVERQWLEKQAEKHLATALAGGTEEASLFFQRDWQGDY